MRRAARRWRLSIVGRHPQLQGAAAPHESRAKGHSLPWQGGRGQLGRASHSQRSRSHRRRRRARRGCSGACHQRASQRKEESADSSGGGGGRAAVRARCDGAGFVKTQQSHPSPDSDLTTPLKYSTGLLNSSGKFIIRHVKRYIVGPAASDRRRRALVDLLERGAAARVAPLLPLLVVEQKGLDGVSKKLVSNEVYTYLLLLLTDLLTDLERERERILGHARVLARSRRSASIALPA